MFEQAAWKHYKWNCSVGGISDDLRGMTVGMGCFLSDEIVLSAAHVWSGVAGRYTSPFVIHAEGGFRCEVLREWPEWDIILLRTVERIFGSATEPSNEAVLHPPLSQEKMYLGREVGMFSRLSLADEETDHGSLNLFTAGRVSSWCLPSTENQKVMYGLSNTIVQRGFSGSAVFLADGSVVGVLVQTLSFPIDRMNLSFGRYAIPLGSPLYEIRQEIAGLL
jgi:hypothetical protein